MGGTEPRSVPDPLMRNNQLMRLGWLGVADMADLAIIDGYGEGDSFLRIYLDVAVSDTYNDGQVLTDDGSVDH